MAQGRHWSDEDEARLLQWAGEGMSFGAIGGELRREQTATRRRYYDLLGRMMPADRDAALALRNAGVARRRGAFRASARELADLAARRALEPLTITAAVLGDPLPGRSALDRKRFETVIPSITLSRGDHHGAAHH